MRMYEMKAFGGLALLSIFLLGCPKPADDDYAQQACSWNPNYVYVNGECICPEGFFEIGTEPSDYSCLPRQEGSYLMKAIGDCFCGSEMIFMLGSGAGNDNSNHRPFTIVYNGNEAVHFPLGCEYIPREDGDEIRMDYTAEIRCMDGVMYFVQMNGKFNVEKTQMTANVVFHELVDRVFIMRDSCTYLLTQ